MKITPATTGRVTINPTLRKVRIMIVSPITGEEVATDETGYYVSFSGLPLKFFVHQARNNRDKNQTGFALTEETTGRRVAWAKTDFEVVQLAQDRLDGFLRAKGKAALLSLITTSRKADSLRQGYDGVNDKSKPEDDPKPKVRWIGRLRIAN